MTIPIGKSVILLLSMFASASAGPTVCRQAASFMRIGGAAGSSILGGVTGLVTATEDDTQTEFAKWSVDRTFSKEVESLNQEGQATTRVKWLIRDKVGAVEIIVGTADCQHLRFFQVKHGRVFGIPAPERLRTDDACGGDSVWLGTIGGKPYAVEEISNDRTRGIIASSWLGTMWGPSCRLSQTYSERLEIDGQFCRRQSDCTFLAPAALQAAETAQQEHDKKTPDVGSVPQTASTLGAGAIALPAQLPTFGSEQPIDGFTTFTDQKVFRVPHLDQSIVGLVGGGQRGWRDYDGWLVGFWRANTNEYEPVAAFRFKRQLGTVRSITVEGLKNIRPHTPTLTGNPVSAP